MTLILNLIFKRGRVTKILSFALKIRGVVGRVVHGKSSDPAIPLSPPKKKLKRAHGRHRFVGSRMVGTA